ESLSEVSECTETTKETSTLLVTQTILSRCRGGTLILGALSHHQTTPLNTEANTDQDRVMGQDRVMIRELELV
ncbi:hypothetical protein JOQ06_024639, partial [Pogonophryne albipinna]